MPRKGCTRWERDRFVAVHPAEGAWTAAAKLGLNLAPAPSPAEREKRDRMRAELEAELARPFIESAGTGRADRTP